MQILYRCFLLMLLSIQAQAGIIALSNFDGSESLINFDGVSPGIYSGSYVRSGVNIEAESGSYIFQNTGWLLGTNSYAFNTFGTYPDAKNDIAISFASAITRFGMNFGNAIGSHLSAIVIAYDTYGNVIESHEFTDFDNGFIGFDFSSVVSKIVIDRTDGTDYFTFLDDIRFLPSVTVAEPTSLILVLLGLASVIGLRSRKS